MRFRNAFTDPPIKPGYYICRWTSAFAPDKRIFSGELLARQGSVIVNKRSKSNRTRAEFAPGIVWGNSCSHTPDNTGYLEWLDDPRTPVMMEKDLMWGLLYASVQRYIVSARWATPKEVAEKTRLWGDIVFEEYADVVEALFKGEKRAKMADIDLLNALGYQDVREAVNPLPCMTEEQRKDWWDTFTKTHG